jgi:hypothetical protein
VLLGALISVLRGHMPYLLDTYIAEAPVGERGIDYRVSRGWQVLTLMLSLPMTLLLVACLGLLVVKRRRPALCVLGWLLTLAVPIVVLTSPPRARYLSITSPAIALIFGAGMVLIGDMIAARWKGRMWVQFAPAGLALGLWAVGFALPFDRNTWADPVALKLPKIESMNYFYGSANAWGSREAVRYIEAHGERGPDGRIPVYATVFHCSVAEVYLDSSIDWHCRDVHKLTAYDIYPELYTWDVITHGQTDLPFVYVISEYTLETGWPPYSPPLHWEWLYDYTRPHGGHTIAVWKVTNAG